MLGPQGQMNALRKILLLRELVYNKCELTLLTTYKQFPNCFVHCKLHASY